MKHTELQELSRLREREAKTLLKAGLWSGAYYVGGYSAEFAIKAVIAVRMGPQEFPNKKFANDVWTHDLTKLVGFASLDPGNDQVDKRLKVNWGIVKDWSEQSRFVMHDQVVATDFLSALSRRKYGVLPWVRQHW